MSRLLGLIMSKTKHYYEFGLFAPIFEVRRNLNIYKKIAENILTIETTDKYTQQLYSYLQHASQNAFVLGACKIFDRPNKKNETLCILNFLQQIQNDSELKELRKTWKFKYKLGKFNLNSDLVKKLETSPNQAKSVFLKFYTERYESDFIQEKIKTILFIRDKFVAHNELIEKGFNFNPKIVEELMDFAQELTETFNELFVGGMYFTNHSDESAYFITHAINRLNEESKTNK